MSPFAVNVANLSKKKENWHKFYSSCRLVLSANFSKFNNNRIWECSWFSVLFIKFSERRQSQNQRRICVIKEIPRNCIKIMTWKGLLFQISFPPGDFYPLLRNPLKRWNRDQNHWNEMQIVACQKTKMSWRSKIFTGNICDTFSTSLIANLAKWLMRAQQ